MNSRRKERSQAKDSQTAVAGGEVLAAQGLVSKAAYITYFALAIAGGSIDLLTKQAVFGSLGYPGEQPTWWLIQDRLGIQTALNPGALFGMGGGKRLIFASLSIAALIGIFTWLFVYKAARDRWLTVALGIITGGIIGNLFDRLGMWHWGGLPVGVDAELTGAVRDWILFQWKEVPLKIFNPWPNFNIADSFLVTGAIMLAIHALTYREPKPTEEPKASPAT
jgi:signal peptidase II